MGYYLLNEEVLVGPIWDIEKLWVHYERNFELYGELGIIKLGDNKEIKYLKKEDIFNGVF